MDGASLFSNKNQYNRIIFFKGIRAYHLRNAQNIISSTTPCKSAISDYLSYGIKAYQTIRNQLYISILR